jgi:HK97 gp10 family phage protein
MSALKITGLKELEKSLNKLPKELQRQSETTALREGMKPVLKSARSLSGKSRDTGLLQKSIGMNVRKTRKGISARVGARTGYAKTVKRNGKDVYSDPVKYAHLVEYGTSHSAAKPFIRPSIESSTDAINKGIADGYQKGLSKALTKLATKK